MFRASDVQGNFTLDESFLQLTPRYLVDWAWGMAAGVEAFEMWVTSAQETLTYSTTTFPSSSSSSSSSSPSSSQGSYVSSGLLSTALLLHLGREEVVNSDCLV